MSTSSLNKVIITSEEKFLRVILPDSIGMDEYRAIEKQIVSQVNEKNCKLVIDLSRTNAIYSSGVGLIIRLRKVVTDINGALYVVNISKKLRDLFQELNLDKVLPLYATDVEFDISCEDVWKSKVQSEHKFVFISQIENNLYRLTFSGQMSSFYDLSSINEFHPQKNIHHFVVNLENLDAIDTFGGQLFNDFIERLKNTGARIAFYGAQNAVQEVIRFFPSLKLYTIYKLEKDAIESIL